MIEHRISSLSSSEEIFQEVVEQYNIALKKAGYDKNLHYKAETSTTTQNAKKKKRKRNIIWFNPPFNKATSTNVGAKFLTLIEKHFPSESPLSKILNRNTIKISYSTLPNMEQIISNHNKRILRGKEADETNCNCRLKATCPVDNKCIENSVVYKALVTPDPTSNRKNIPTQAEYIGLSSNPFKTRFNNHQMTFRQEKYKQSTSLSNFVWELKNIPVQYKIDWSIIGKAATYHPSTRSCSLCLSEKALILMSDHKFPLNKRSELLSKCRHREKFLLSKFL